MYPENPEGTQVIVGPMNIWDIYRTLPGIELTTCSVPSGPLLFLFSFFKILFFFLLGGGGANDANAPTQ